MYSSSNRSSPNCSRPGGQSVGQTGQSIAIRGSAARYETACRAVSSWPACRMRWRARGLGSGDWLRKVWPASAMTCDRNGSLPLAEGDRFIELQALLVRASPETAHHDARRIQVFQFIRCNERLIEELFFTAATPRLRP